MNFLDSLKGSIDDDTKKKIFIFGGIAVGLVILIIIIAVIVSIINRKTPYVEVENIMAKAAYKYLQDNKDLLPNETNLTTTVNTSVLTEKEYMKELKKYTKDESCKGEVVVKYKNGDYDYQGYLTCKNYKTELLIDRIKKDNPVVVAGDGLYDETEFLRFRGEYVNNYLKVGNINYRILKVGSDNKIYITPQDMDDMDEKIYIYWDDRYNTEEDISCGINDYNLSRIKKSLDGIYDSLDGLIKKNATTYTACIGKRSETNTDNSGTTECGNKIEDAKIGLIPIYEYIKGSIAPECKSPISKECKNYNYLIIDKAGWWTLTGVSTDTSNIFYVNANGEIDKEKGDSRKLARYVVALKGETLLNGGKGTKSNPYTIR